MTTTEPGHPVSGTRKRQIRQHTRLFHTLAIIELPIRFIPVQDSGISFWTSGTNRKSILVISHKADHPSLPASAAPLEIHRAGGAGSDVIAGRPLLDGFRFV